MTEVSQVQAAHIAEKVIEKAEKAAQVLAEKAHEKSVEVASDALRRVFGENEEAKRFIDVSRIPLICKSIIDLNERSVENRIWQKGQATMMKVLIGVLSAVGLALLGAITVIAEKVFTK